MNRSANAISCRLLLVTAIIAASGCVQQPRIVRDQPVIDPDARAIALHHDGRFLASAEEYLRIAATAAQSAARLFRARAVEAFIDGGDLVSARQWSFDSTASADGDQATAALELLNNARLAYVDGGQRADASLITALDLELLTPYSQARALELQASIAERNEDYLTAARTRIAYDARLGSAELRRENQRSIWKNLLAARSLELQSVARSADPEVAGWGELALLARDALFDAPRFRAELDSWRAAYGGHAAHSLLEDIMALSTRFSTLPRRIALLLPFNSRFADLADAIRDGFLTAWYADAANGNRPLVRVYNATESNIAAVYRQTLADGAELVIGPLSKEALQHLLSEFDPLPVMTLALNTLDDTELQGLAINNLVQFGLPPEHEAQQVAKRAWYDGHERGIVLAPDSTWGSRVADAFTTQWRALGGEVVESVAYRGNFEQYADAVEKALNVDASKERHRIIQDAAGQPIEFETRRRKDLDFVFVAGFPTDARQILPQLRFLRAGDIPVYATHHVYTGIVDMTLDQDLDGVIFGDMPWILGLRDQDTFAIVRELWGDRLNDDARFFAFGMDAYRVIPYLGRLLVQGDTRLAANTGYLRIGPSAVIERQLGWAQFGNGIPIPLGERGGEGDLNWQ